MRPLDPFDDFAGSETARRPNRVHVISEDFEAAESREPVRLSPKAIDTPAPLREPVLTISDRPIVDPSQDSLRRDQFAQHVAHSLRNHPANDPLVVGLLGKWGSGKTSLLNLIEHHLAEGSSAGDVPIVVRFNPWLFADQNQLSRRFFQTLATAFQNEGSKAARAAGRAIDERRATRLADMIEQYAKLFEPLQSFGPAGAIAVQSSGLISWLWRRKVVQLSADLDGFKTEIDGTLRDLGRRVVVMIDDIDRLSVDEIVQVFQLVRLMADFANTIYVLAFDRRMVSNALEKVQQIDGNEYIEKIVQVSLTVPALPLAEFAASASATLLDLMEQGRPQRPIDVERFRRVFVFASQWFLETPRNVAKLVATFRFHLVLLERDRDYVDLLAITMLQIFAPGLYEQIRDNLELFVVPASRADSGAKRIAQAVVASATEIDQEDLTAFLHFLFPQLTATLQGGVIGASETQELESAKRIGHAASADAYFAFTLRRNEFSDSKWKALLEALRGADEQAAVEAGVAMMLAPVDESELRWLVERIASEVRLAANSAMDLMVWRRLARVLWATGDKLVSPVGSAKERDHAETRVLQCIEDLIATHQDENDRYAVVQAMYNTANPATYIAPAGLYVPSLFLTLLRCQRGKSSLLGGYRYAYAPERRIVGGDDHFDNVTTYADTLIHHMLRNEETVPSEVLIDVVAALCDMDRAGTAIAYVNQQIKHGHIGYLIGAIVASEDRYTRLGAPNAVLDFLRTLRDVRFDLLAAKLKDPGLTKQGARLAAELGHSIVS